MESIVSNKQTKTELSRALFESLQSGTRDVIENKSIRQSFIAIAQSEIGMSKGAAMTYYTNLMNEAKGAGMYCHTTRIKTKKTAVETTDEVVS